MRIACLWLGLLLPGCLTAGSLAIVDARVHTLTEAGVLEGATVLITDGRISAVGRKLSLPEGAERIDAAGCIVTPGLFGALTHLGVEEICGVAETVDARQAGQVYSAAFDVAFAFNPRSVVIPVNRIEGVTRAAVVPMAAEETGSVIGGQAAVVALAGPRPVMRRGAAMLARLGERGSDLAGGSRVAALLALRNALEDAQDFAGHRAQWEKGARRDYVLSRKDLEALQPVLRGEMPLLVEAERASDIEQALQLAVDFGVRLAIAGGTEAWLVAEELAAAEVPVIVDPQTNLPESFAQLNATLHNAARLHAAGVPVALSVRDRHNVRNMTQYAGLAVAHGLPYEAALAAIMRVPAEIYGVDGEVGTLAPGRVADLVLWSGDPLELMSHAEAVFIAGERVPAVSRSTLLRDRYRKLDRAWPYAYPRQ